MSAYTQYQEYGGNPYTNAPDGEAGNYNGGAANQHDQHLRPEQQHEMSSYSADSNYSNAANAVGEGSGPMSQASFLEHVDFAKLQIRELSDSIGKLATLHLRALSESTTKPSSELVALETSTQSLNESIRNTLRKLKADAEKDPNSNVKATQYNTLKREFERQLRDFNKEELQYRQSYRTAIERQYRIVNPDATDAEVQQASEMDWGNEGVFQTALKSNRSGQAVSTLGNVRARHNELQKIEQTISQLAQLFQELGGIVEATEPIIQRTEENAINTGRDVERATDEINKAKEHAQRVRRLKWWLFFVILLIVAGIGLGVGLGIGLKK